MCVCSHILKVPFEGSEGSGIVYIWIGSKTTQEEAIHAEQMGRSMFEVRVGHESDGVEQWGGGGGGGGGGIGSCYIAGIGGE